jgi:hypothetical protein
VVGRPGPALAEAEAEGPRLSVDGIDQSRRADVTRPADPGPGEEPGVALGDAEERLRGIVDPLDPVGTARQRHVAVSVDHARHEGRARRIDDLEPGPGGHFSLIVGRPNPADPTLLDEDADADPQAIRTGVGQRPVAVERPVRRPARRVRGRPAASHWTTTVPVIVGWTSQMK